MNKKPKIIDLNEYARINNLESRAHVLERLLRDTKQELRTLKRPVKIRW